MLVDGNILKKQIGGIQQALTFATVEPFCMHGELWFKKKVGKEVYDWLNAFNTTDNVPIDDVKDLLWFAQGAVSWYAFQLGKPQLQYRTGDMGTMKNQPNNSVAMTKWEYVKGEENNFQMIDMCLENFFMLLDNILPTVWKEADAYVQRRAFIIQSATELTDYLPICKGSVRLYESLKPYLRRVENLYLQPILTKNILVALKENLVSDELSAVENELLEHCRQVVAPMVLLESLPYITVLVDTEGIRMVEKSDGTRNELMANSGTKNDLLRKLNLDGNLAITQLKNYLNATATELIFKDYWEVNLKPENITPKIRGEREHFII